MWAGARIPQWLAAEEAYQAAHFWEWATQLQGWLNIGVDQAPREEERVNGRRGLLPLKVGIF